MSSCVSAAGSLCLRFELEYDNGGPGFGPHDLRTLKHDAIFKYGQPMRISFQPLVKFKHKTDPKQAIVHRPDIKIRVLYLRFFPQTQPDGADSGAENPVEDGLTSQPIAAPHVRHCLVSFNLPFSEIVRHHEKPGETHGIQLKSSLHGDHHKGDLQRKSTIQIHLELDVKVRRDLPANALIRTKFNQAMKHFIQKVKSL